MTGAGSLGVQDLQVLGPVIILTALALILVLADVVLRVCTRGRRGLGLTGSVVLTLVGSGVAFAYSLWLWNRVNLAGLPVVGKAFIAHGPPSQLPQHMMAPGQAPILTWKGAALVADHFALFIVIGACLVLAYVALLLLPHLRRSRLYRSEIFPLLTISAIGMMLLGMSRDLLVTFIAIEILSLPLYVLCGLDETRSGSREAALKYFLLGAFASGFFIYGAALIYGMSGHLNYAAIADYMVKAPEPPIFIVGVALVGVGLCFKLALAPFHAWVPDVYQGAPTPLTGYMAVGVKVATFAAALRFFVEAATHADVSYWRAALAVFAVLSMLVGNLFALHQMSAKRLLAYSAIAHTGYLAVGLCVAGPEVSASILVYLAAYGLAAMGAFAMISYLAPPEQDDVYLDEMYDLSRRTPGTAIALVILMLSLAGFPLTAGFIGKLLVFADAWHAGLYALVILAVLNSVVGVYYYLRFVMAMYMQPRVPGAVELKPPRMSGAYAIPALVTVVLTLLFGVLPGVLIDWARSCTIGL